MLVVPGCVIRLAAGIPPGEDGVDFVETLVIVGGKRQRWLRLDEDAAALGKINRLGRPEDPALVDDVDGFHAG